MKTPKGIAQVVATFGDATKMSPVVFEAANIVRIILPESLSFDGQRITRITCHRLLAGILSATLLAAHNAGLWSVLDPYGGGYANRLKRGYTKLSMHAFGIAWDFNPEAYPLGSDERMPDQLVSIFTANGFVYGGDFIGRKDPQHFQFASGV